MSPDRLPIIKTHKLFINAQYPRSESGRAIPVHAPGAKSPAAYVAHASRKDLRAAVEAARAAQPAWAARDAYNRAQILYRMAEMIEGKRAEFRDAIPLTTRPTDNPTGCPLTPDDEISAAVDRLVAFAGWADKFAQVLGCQNPVAGPYHNFTIPEPVGLTAIVTPDTPALLALITLLAPAIAVGNTTIAIVSDAHPVPAAILAEACNTADVPPGVINLLTAQRAELIPWIASHRDIDAIIAANMDSATTKALRDGAAENLKRVTVRTIAEDDWLSPRACESPACIEPAVEFKTIWHPARV
ncbi:MAG: aldehyde dehydrogenase family protein [Phycisphaerales bacterium]